MQSERGGGDDDAIDVSYVDRDDNDEEKDDDEEAKEEEEEENLTQLNLTKKRTCHTNDDEESDNIHTFIQFYNIYIYPHITQYLHIFNCWKINPKICVCICIVGISILYTIWASVFYIITSTHTTHTITWMYHLFPDKRPIPKIRTNYTYIPKLHTVREEDMHTIFASDLFHHMITNLRSSTIHCIKSTDYEKVDDPMASLPNMLILQPGYYEQTIYDKILSLSWIPRFETIAILSEYYKSYIIEQPRYLFNLQEIPTPAGFKEVRIHMQGIRVQDCSRFTMEMCPFIQVEYDELIIQNSKLQFLHKAQVFHYEEAFCIQSFINATYI